MTVQRRRGLPLQIYPITTVVDSRQNKQKHVDLENPIPGKAWTFPQRGAKAEVPGQQHINVTRIGVDAKLADLEPESLYVENVDLWARVDFQGKTWDIVSPPAFHNGTRHTRHWSFDLRERP